MSKFDPYEHLKILRNPDGSIIRLIDFPKIPASAVATTSSSGKTSLALSKDLPLNPHKNTSLRLYLPSNTTSSHSLPVIIYFHSGAWFLLSTANEIPHRRCSDLAAAVPSLVVSVDYRLAPEHRIPAPFDDAVDALHWTQSQATDPAGEPWLRAHADFSRVYLAGCSNGANIAFNAALRVPDLNLNPIRVAGLILNQPMFSGMRRTESEVQLADDPVFPLPAMDVIWEMALPPGTDRDHRYCNPFVEGPHRQRIRMLAPTLVIGFNGDLNMDRQQELVTKLLLRNGVRVKAHFEGVGFHLIDAVDSRRAAVVINHIKDFIDGFSNM